MEKTNVMRLLQQAKIEFETSEYEFDESDLSGLHVAKEIGMPCEEVFKTLVTCSKDGYFVFLIPVNKELNLKMAAKAAKQKSVEMLNLKDLTKVTGYIRGGCSPIGMKKQYPTFIDNSAINFEKIAFSAGKRGIQIVLNAEKLAKYINAFFFNLTQ